MSELLQAAKAVIVQWDRNGYPVELVMWEPVKQLRAAVERAEKQDIAYFDEWMKQNATEELKAVDRVDLFGIWYVATHAERERIRARAQIAAEKTWKAGDWYVGPQHNMIDQFVEELLEDGDE